MRRDRRSADGSAADTASQSPADDDAGADVSPPPPPQDRHGGVVNAAFDEVQLDAAGDLFHGYSVDVLEQALAIRVYRRRWLLLAIVGALIACSSMLWNSFVTIANLTDEFYCTYKGCQIANWLMLIFMMVDMPAGALAVWSGDVFGLRVGILSCACIDVVGSLLRVLSGIGALPQGVRLGLVVAGQAVAATAMPIAMQLPSKLAALWFPATQRATALSMATLCFPITAAVTLFTTAAVVKVPAQVIYPSIAGLALSLTVLVCSALVVRSSTPPSPPSAAAVAKASLPFWAGLRAIVRIRSYLMLILTLGFVGLANAVGGLSQQILCSIGYSNVFLGVLNMIMLAAGVLGGTVCGALVDKTKRYTLIIKSAFAISAVCTAIHCILFQVAGAHALLCVNGVVLGFASIGAIIVGQEVAVEITYPISQNTVVGLSIMSMQLHGVVFMLLMPRLATEVSVDNYRYAAQTCVPTGANQTAVRVLNWRVPLIVWAAYSCALLLFVGQFFFRPKLRRMAEETAVRKASTALQQARSRAASVTSNPSTTASLADILHNETPPAVANAHC